MKLHHMKNKLLLQLVLILFSIKLNCQSKNDFIVQLGYSQASQSPNAYNVFLTSYWDQNIHNGFFNFEYYRNLKNKNSIGVGVQIVEKGFQNNYTFQYPSYDYNVRYTYSNNYIECLLSYRKSFKKFFFNTGVVFSYLLFSSKASSTKRTYPNGDVTEFRGSNIDTYSNKRYDVGVLLRFGYQIKNRINLNLTFTRGFIRPYIYPSGELNYNEVFMFGISYNLSK